MVLSEQEIKARASAFDGWNLSADGWLRCLKVFSSFNRMLLFANAVGYLAETLDHHPDLFLHSYNRLMISVRSHDVDGITEKDFHLIERIEALPTAD